MGRTFGCTRVLACAVRNTPAHTSLHGDVQLLYLFPRRPQRVARERVRLGARIDEGEACHQDGRDECERPPTTRRHRVSSRLARLSRRAHCCNASWYVVSCTTSSLLSPRTAVTTSTRFSRCVRGPRPARVSLPRPLYASLSVCLSEKKKNSMAGRGREGERERGRGHQDPRIQRGPKPKRGWR